MCCHNHELLHASNSEMRAMRIGSILLVMFKIFLDVATTELFHCKFESTLKGLHICIACQHTDGNSFGNTPTNYGTMFRGLCCPLLEDGVTEINDTKVIPNNDDKERNINH